MHSLALQVMLKLASARIQTYVQIMLDHPYSEGADSLI